MAPTIVADGRHLLLRRTALDSRTAAKVQFMAIEHAHRIGVFPGQFDPITYGHLDVIRCGVKLFDELIVAVGINPEMRPLFSVEERVAMMRLLLQDMPSVRVQEYSRLTVDLCREVGATAILRGIHSASDMRHETQFALANRAAAGIETLLVFVSEQHAMTSSSLVRQVVALGGDPGVLLGLLPPIVVERLRQKQQELRRTAVLQTESPII
jgi:pantetheine-phosphate adenylyltransferase